LEILPPKAATRPGRNLPRLLIVGEQVDTFPDLNSALEASIPGDIIEIRTDRPISVRPHAYRRDGGPADRTLTIRAGNGFRPVLRMKGAPGTVIFDVTAVELVLEGLNLVTHVQDSRGSTMILVSSDCSVTYRRCTLTSLPPTITECIRTYEKTSTKTSRPLRLTFERCFLRGENLPVSLPMDGGDVRIEQTLVASLGYPLTAFFGPVELQRGSVTLSHVSYVSDWGNPGGGAISLGLGEPTASPGVRQIDVHCRECVLAPGDKGVLGLTSPTDPTTWPEVLRSGQLSWRGQRNVFSPGILFGVFSGHQPSQAFVAVDNLARWTQLGGAISEAESHQAEVTFANPFGPNDRWQCMPQDYAILAIEGLHPRQWQDIGCDVNNLPVPPLITLQPFDLVEPYPVPQDSGR
jgi:hypothetical protein